MTERRRMIVAIGGPVALLLAYLLYWPVPVEPVAWDAPADAGLVDGGPVRHPAILPRIGARPLNRIGP